MMGRYIEGGLKINSLGDLIGGENNEICDVPLSELHEFKNHPFKVRDDNEMKKLVESIREHGVIEPAIVRPVAEGGYIIISGHRRKKACEILGIDEMPVLIRKFTDDEATITMVDSNLQREEILPSEKAFSYKMKLEALKRRAGRPSKINSCRIDTNFSEDNISQEDTNYRADEELAKQSVDCASTIQRYIRLTELLADLLDMVDNKNIKFYAAVEISYLTKKQQEILLKVIREDNVYPSLSQAKQLRKLYQDKNFTKQSVHAVLTVMAEKGRRITINQNVVTKYFTPETSDDDIERIICSLLEEWQKNGGKV